MVDRMLKAAKLGEILIEEQDFYKDLLVFRSETEPVKLRLEHHLSAYILEHVLRRSKSLARLILRHAGFDAIEVDVIPESKEEGASPDARGTIDGATMSSFEFKMKTLWSRLGIDDTPKNEIFCYPATPNPTPTAKDKRAHPWVQVSA
jgi:hypothetical protein